MVSRRGLSAVAGDPSISEHILTSLIEQAPQALALMRGPDFIFELVNQPWTALVSERAYLGRPYRDVYPEVVAGSDIYSHIQHVYETGETFVAREMPVDVQFKPKTVETRYYSFSYHRLTNANGSRYGVFCSAVDVTDELRSQQALLSSEEKLSIAVETEKIGFFDLDLTTGDVEYSEQMRRDWGIKEDKKLTGASAMERVHPDDRAMVTKLSKMAIVQGEPYLCQYRVVRPDGSLIWVEARGRVTRNKEGEPVRFFGTSVDIRRQKIAAEALREAKERAEAANASKTQFLANMSHEIRTPLGAILGYAELLEGNDLTSDERRQFLQTIRRNGEALTTIIDDILDLAKVESGRLKVEKVRLSPVRLFNDVLELFQEKARTKGLYLQINLPDDLPEFIVSDPTRLRQILINLIGNGVKFTHEGGITVKVSKPVLVGSRFKWTMEVIDSGMGIPPARLERLFQPFVQADNTTTRKFGGTGLGLALSRRLARVLDGDVTIGQCEEGRGSTFVVTFLADAAQALSPALQPSSAIAARRVAQSLSGADILLVDDSRDNLILVSRMLTKAGAYVETASNGSEAYRKAIDHAPSLVLMDIQMPVLDGLEATKALRAAGFNQPVVALTAHAMSEEKARTKAAGCDAHLTKPVDRRLMIDTIRGLLSLSD